MITTIPKLAAKHKPRRIGGTRAFTLVELLISATLGGLIMTGVLSAFLFIGRSTINMRNYADMETEARNAMETFAQDVRMASSSNWVASNSVIISTQYNSAPIQYTYVFNKSTSTSRPNGTLTRQRTYPTKGAVDTLILNVKTFTFTAYDINTNPVNLGTVTSANTDTADINTKQIQVSIETQRSSPTLSISTNKVMSARFILRNKSVTA